MTRPYPGSFKALMDFSLTIWKRIKLLADRSHPTLKPGSMSCLRKSRSSENQLYLSCYERIPTIKPLGSVHRYASVPLSPALVPLCLHSFRSSRLLTFPDHFSRFSLLLAWVRVTECVQPPPITGSSPRLVLSEYENKQAIQPI